MQAALAEVAEAEEARKLAKAGSLAKEKMATEAGANATDYLPEEGETTRETDEAISTEDAPGVGGQGRRAPKPKKARKSTLTVCKGKNKRSGVK